MPTSELIERKLLEQREQFFNDALSIPDLRLHERDLLHQTRELLTTNFTDWSSLDAVIVLGASMNYGRIRKKWKFDNVVKNDPSLLVGGHFRITAAHYLDEAGFTGPFLITGGEQIGPNEESVSKAEMLQQAIIKKAKIPRERVIAIGQSGHGNTLGNIQDTIAFWENTGSISQPQKLGLLTNSWHLPRSLLFFLAEEYFTSRGIELIPIAADDMPGKENILYRREVHKFISHPGMGERLAREVNGVRNFFEGQYSPLTV